MDDFSDFAFSTSWNWRGSDDGARVAGEILALGFRKVELNYKITRTMMAAIRPMTARGELEVSSVHAVFPDVKDTRFDTDSRLLGYSDASLRTRAVRLTIRSAEEAVRLGAHVLVVHPGVLPWEELAPGPSGLRGPAYHEKLCSLYRAGMRESGEYRALFEEFSAYRRAGIDAELDRVARSLEEIADHIVRRNLALRIGLENRAICWQIPTFVETDYLLDRLAGAPVGLWLDTGHGTILRNLGFFDDRLEMARFKNRLIGMHIHDTDGIDDHWTPYLKTDGLDDYLDLIAAAPIKVLELGAKNPAELIPAGARKLAGKLRART